MHRPWTGTERAAPKVAAVTMPTRRPVYGPGPTPTTIPVTASSVRPSLGEHPVHCGQQQLAVAAGVDLVGPGDDGLAVVQGDGDSGGGGIQSEQQHVTSLRRGVGRPVRALASAGGAAGGADRVLRSAA
ncbi:hypothetical protein GCM10020000_45870 [Streptomyces olivoverticillatus]